MTLKPEKIVGSYLIGQGIAVSGWWVGLVLLPRFVFLFQPKSWPPESTLSFFLADNLFLGIGSIVTGVLAWYRHRVANTFVWMLAAVCWYPTLYCLGVSCLTNEAWLASSCMVSMAGLTLAMATIFGQPTQDPATFRVSSMSPSSAVLWTLGQVVIFWSVFLFILPHGIREVEALIEVPTLQFNFQNEVAILLFVFASAIGFSSAMTMATVGEGTPLPTATAPKLVVRGPYRYIRNPMATAGILQGLSVGLFLGSLGVLFYSILGAFVWHVFVRPVEERDLLTRFGAEFHSYHSRVGLWFPRFRAK